MAEKQVEKKEEKKEKKEIKTEIPVQPGKTIPLKKSKNKKVCKWIGIGFAIIVVIALIIVGGNIFYKWFNKCGNVMKRLNKDITELNVYDGFCDSDNSAVIIEDFPYLTSIVLDDWELGESKIVSIKNCKNLVSITIGNNMFKESYVFELSSIFVILYDKYIYLPSLQTLSIGEECFQIGLSQLTITDFPSLRTLTFGHGSFFWSQSLVISNLPQLTSITLSGGAFLSGTSLSLINLPQLRSISLVSLNFKMGRSFTLQNLPSLTTLTLGSDSFHGTVDFRVINVPNLSSITREVNPSCDGCTAFRYVQCNSERYQVVCEIHNSPKMAQVIMGQDCKGAPGSQKTCNISSSVSYTHSHSTNTTKISNYIKSSSLLFNFDLMKIVLKKND